MNKETLQLKQLKLQFFLLNINLDVNDASIKQKQNKEMDEENKQTDVKKNQIKIINLKKTSFLLKRNRQIILDSIDILGQQQVSQITEIHRNVLNRWKTEPLENKKRGKPLTSLDLELDLINIVKTARVQNKKIAIEKAKELQLKLEISNGFIYVRIHQKEQNENTKDNQYQKKKKDFADQNIIKSFIYELQDLIEQNEIDLDHLINYDETTFEEESHIQVQTNGKDKQSFSIGLAISSTGKKFQQAIIWPSKGIRQIFDYIPQNIKIFYRSEGSYFDMNNFKMWVQQILMPYAQSLPLDKKGLLLIDNSQVHKYDEFKKDLESIRYQVKYLPPNTTNILQPLDTSINKVYKDFYKQKWVEQQFLFNGEQNQKYTHTKFLQKLSDTWNEISQNLIVNSWNIYRKEYQENQEQLDEEYELEIEIYFDNLEEQL